MNAESLKTYLIPSNGRWTFDVKDQEPRNWDAPGSARKDYLPAALALSFSISSLKEDLLRMLLICMR
jgi:hypothetical protein